MLICPPVGGARWVTFALIGSLTFGACTTVSRPSGAQPPPAGGNNQPVSAQAQQLIDEAWQASKNWQCDLMASKIRELKNYMPLNDTIKSLIIADSRCMAITNARANQPQSPPANAGVANAQPTGSAEQEYQRGHALYEGHDYTEAMTWFRQAADQGHALAQAVICMMYVDGQGVRQDYAAAAIWCRRAADQGFAPAQYTLGFMYRDGLGVRQDYTETMRWFRKAADQGLASAQRDLGYLYMVGHGAKQDFSEAMRRSRKAADQGDALAQNNIGVLYEHGLGVRQDNAEAIRWYRKAADQGEAQAKNNVKSLEAIVSEDTSEPLSRPPRLGSPGASSAAQTFICRDNSYRNPVIVTADTAQKMLRIEVTTNNTGVRCFRTYRDGYFGPVMTGQNQLCIALGGGENAHHHVSVRNGQIIARADSDAAGYQIEFDLNTHILRIPGSIDECHRAGG
jgi:tetratricopeptide (TPR) repeat protein